MILFRLRCWCRLWSEIPSFLNVSKKIWSICLSFFFGRGYLVLLLIPSYGAAPWLGTPYPTAYLRQFIPLKNGLEWGKMGYPRYSARLLVFAKFRFSSNTRNYYHDRQYFPQILQKKWVTHFTPLSPKNGDDAVTWICNVPANYLTLSSIVSPLPFFCTLFLARKNCVAELIYKPEEKQRRGLVLNVSRYFGDSLRIVRFRRRIKQLEKILFAWLPIFNL